MTFIPGQRILSFQAPLNLELLSSDMAAYRAPHLPIQTKLNRPLVDGNWVQRPRLISHLNEGLSQRATLISAAAGFGKTSLAVQWLEQLATRSAWLSLDPYDNDLERFLRYLIAALRSAVPGVCAGVEPLLSATTIPPPAYLADALIADLAGLEAPLVLVLDDYHVITSEAIETLMVRLVQYEPAHLHVLSLTRRDPAWPLALWRGRGWLNELRAADLSFCRKEARAFFARDASTAVSTGTVDRLHRQTEGWITGMQLAQLALVDAEDPTAFTTAFSGRHRLIVDFLMDEVIAHQPPEVQEFLGVTAMLERFCAPLCAVLLDNEAVDDCRYLIAYLERENLFLVALDSERMWYRYHHLFQNLLLQHLTEKLTVQRQALLHRRAGKWFAEQGLIEEALHHFLDGGDVDAAATLVERHLHTVIDQDLTRRTLGRWLDLFPPSAETQRPALLVAQAYWKIFSWDHHEVTQLLDQAEALLQNPAVSLPAESRQRLQGDIHVQRSLCLYWQGDAEGTLRHARQALNWVPREHRYAYGVAVVYMAGGYAISGHRDDALALLDKAILEGYAENNGHIGQLLVSRMGILHMAGDLAATRDTANRMLAMHDAMSIPDYWYGYAPYFLGCVAYERNHLDTAAEQFGRVEQMRYRVTTRLYHDSLIGLALVAQAREEADRARAYAVAAQSFAIEAKDTPSIYISNLFNARQAILSGKVAGVAAADPPPPDSHQFWLRTPGLMWAEYFLGKGTPVDCDAALQCIEEGLQQAEHHHHRRQTIQLLALKALALHGIGRMNGALEVLAEALQAAEPLGLVRTFVDHGPVMADLLHALLQRNPDVSYVHNLLEAFGRELTSDCRLSASTGTPHDAEAELTADGPPADDLTNRERDVLSMLAARLSNKEIAERLYVSPETVKTHAMNLYRKLDVGDRRQAVRVARQHGLLPANPC